MSPNTSVCDPISADRRDRRPASRNCWRRVRRRVRPKLTRLNSVTRSPPTLLAWFSGHPNAGRRANRASRAWPTRPKRGLPVGILQMTRWEGLTHSVRNARGRFPRPLVQPQVLLDKVPTERTVVDPSTQQGRGSCEITRCDRDTLLASSTAGVFR
jgi:hypothetical protein